MAIEGEDLYEDVRSAFTAAEELQDEPTVEETADDSSSVEQTVRDEAGRFAKKQETEANNAEVQPVEEAVPSAPVALSTEKPPQSWTPSAREKWATLDPEIKAEVIRREEASANGVRQIQEKFAPMQGFVEQMRPVAAEAQAVGSDPVTYIHNMAMSERTLRTADMPTKFNELLRIADQYGIPLRDVINKSVGQEVLKAPQQQQMQLPPELQQELAAIRQWRQESERGQANQIVTQFGSDKEFINDVRNVMADLIERGMAADLPTAYDQACWMVPEVRQVMLARQGQAATAGAITQKQVKAAGASLSAGGKVAVADEGSEDDDISATVRRAFVAAQGRV